METARTFHTKPETSDERLEFYARLEKKKGRNAVYVLPEDETRALAIVKEIVEGAPPE